VIGPVSPKAHGAWLGAGTGAAVANEVIQLIQTYGHTVLPAATTSLIYTVVPAIVAFVGAWLAPLLPAKLEDDAEEIATAHLLTHRQQVPPQIASMLAPLPNQEKELIPTGSTAGWPTAQTHVQTAEGQPHE
jgi:hypothetical protein